MFKVKKCFSCVICSLIYFLFRLLKRISISDKDFMRKFNKSNTRTVKRIRHLESFFKGRKIGERPKKKQTGKTDDLVDGDFKSWKKNRHRQRKTS